MDYTLMDKIRMFLCRVLGHFPRNPWEFEGQTYASCKCCRTVIKRAGKKWVL